MHASAAAQDEALGGAASGFRQQAELLVSPAARARDKSGAEFIFLFSVQSARLNDAWKIISAANFICAPGARRRAWPRADRCRQWSGGVARQNFRSLAARRISFSAFSLLLLRAHPRLHLEFAQTFIDHPHHPQESPSRRPPHTPAHAFCLPPSATAEFLNEKCAMAILHC